MRRILSAFLGLLSLGPQAAATTHKAPEQDAPANTTYAEKSRQIDTLFKRSVVDFDRINPGEEENYEEGKNHSFANLSDLVDIVPIADTSSPFNKIV